MVWITTNPHDFEFITEIEGNELTVCAGGRHDGLHFGGPATTGFGFGIGVERILLFLKRKALNLPIETGLDALISVLGDVNVKQRLAYSGPELRLCRT